MVITFCGHSNYVGNSLDEGVLFDFLENTVKNEYCEFFLGGYGGFDAFAYSLVKKFQKAHKNCRLAYITPYNTEAHLKRVAETAKFDFIIYPPLESVPKRYAILKRNEWIIEKADIIVAFVNHSYGGAYKMLSRAIKNGKKIFNLAAQSKNSDTP